MSIKTSFSDLVGSMISAYAYLRNHAGKKATGIRYLDETIQFLTQLKSKGNLSTHNYSEKEIARFFRIFLDIAGIVSATKGKFEPLSIGDVRLIGKRREVSGILSGGQTSVDDWICSTLFQGWVRMHEPDLRISDDLRYKISKYGRNCDFEVVGSRITSTLIECKRLHPFYLDKKFEDDVPLIVDISSYGDNCSKDITDGRKVGLDEKTEIVALLAQLAKEKIRGINQLTLAWSDVFFFSGAPRALAYYTKSMVIDNMDMAQPGLSYAGWAVEFYPTGKDLHKYQELRLSKIARSCEWIHTSWLSSTDNLVTFGPVETKPDKEPYSKPGRDTTK